jgi:hypothetical protein
MAAVTATGGSSMSHRVRPDLSMLPAVGSVTARTMESLPAISADPPYHRS